MNVLDVKNISVQYKVHGNGWFGQKTTKTAVDNVSLSLEPGEVLGLVGESGCGKTSLGRAIIRLIPCATGSVSVDGVDFLSLRGQELRKHRGKIQMVFQDPYASLDPRMTIYDTLEQPLVIRGIRSSVEIAKKIRECLDKVGLSWKATARYPHEFSGGQRQRISIGRALITNPKIIIADEPVSSLDVSMQAQILNLLKDVQSEMKLAMLFISHNLAVVRYISSKIAVMQKGKVIETGNADTIYSNPLQQYTKVLIQSIPVPDPKIERTKLLG